MLHVPPEILVLGGLTQGAEVGLVVVGGLHRGCMRHGCGRRGDTHLAADLGLERRLLRAERGPAGAFCFAVLDHGVGRELGPQVRLPVGVPARHVGQGCSRGRTDTVAIQVSVDKPQNSSRMKFLVASQRTTASLTQRTRACCRVASEK